MTPQTSLQPFTSWWRRVEKHDRKHFQSEISWKHKYKISRATILSFSKNLIYFWKKFLLCLRQLWSSCSADQYVWSEFSNKNNKNKNNTWFFLHSNVWAKLQSAEKSFNIELKKQQATNKQAEKRRSLRFLRRDWLSVIDQLIIGTWMLFVFHGKVCSSRKNFTSWLWHRKWCHMFKHRDFHRFKELNMKHEPQDEMIENKIIFYEGNLKKKHQYKTILQYWSKSISWKIEFVKAPFFKRSSRNKKSSQNCDSPWE